MIRVPLDLALDAEMAEAEERAEASLAEAKLLGAEHGVEVVGTTVRARAIGTRDRRPRARDATPT